MRNLSTARHHVRVSYFTAVIAGDGRSWRARDVDVEDAGTLDDLADMLRAASHRGGPVLAVIEREDEWFALVRVDDDDEEPRLFVSDMDAASRSSYAELLAPAADVDADGGPLVTAEVDPDADPEAVAPGSDDEDPEDDEDPHGDPDDDPDDEVTIETWAGEPDLLEDLGVGGTELRALVERQSDDPAGVLAEVGEVCGFGELLEALR
jgi:putative tRNA adenosine deaminase-associated protein